MEISGTRWLVTGATRGIGRALAEHLARLPGEEVRLALVARSAAPLEALAKELGATAYPADLAAPDAAAQLAERVEADGPVDVLVNNAGVSNIGYVLDQSPGSIEELFRTNLSAPIHLCQRLVPGMVQRGRGHVVNMGSIAGVVTPPGLVHYGASKAALAHYTEGLRLELRDLPVGLTLVEIGSTATDMDDSTQAYPPYAALRRGRPVEKMRFPIEQVVEGIVDAVRRDRPHLVLPASLRPVAWLPALPRKLMRLLFRKVELRPQQG